LNCSVATAPTVLALYVAGKSPNLSKVLWRKGLGERIKHCKISLDKCHEYTYYVY